MATSRLVGGSALRARLVALATVPDDFAASWAEEAADRMRRTKPHSERAASSKFTTKATKFRAGVYGAFWWIFQDRGTKAHDIFGSSRRNPPDNLMFTIGGRTIFAKKVHLPRMRRRPFITRAAQEALHGGAEFIIKTWNGRRVRGAHRKFL